MKKIGYILIGFGDFKLTQLLAEVKEEKINVKEVALLSMNEVPHYRSFTASSLEEQKAFVDYLSLMSEFTKETEQ